MAPSTSTESSLEVPEWLKTLPVAPEYYPTLSEFQDPISYIHKIEEEASKYGICKIIPPLPPSPKKTAILNFNRSLSALNLNSNPKAPPTFTTREQLIGFDRSVQKPVWQSGESYTFQQFEAKAKQFEKTLLKKSGKKGFSALEIETLFWEACFDEPLSVEYANDIPGSAFVPVNWKKLRETGEAATVGETAWNMRGVSRLKGSLLRFMKEDIAGVSSPMVYLAMLFSWFAWHVEDHDLHSLNYLHTGAARTWYAVPREAAAAFEEVIRVHGYGEEVNPLVTFSILSEKTTVMSPEVLIGAGIPCCRLVQNAGEFVVVFPRAYHSGLNHGFNCGEAANIATPEWLRFAKEAAIRRASINYPPLVTHFQLLYAHALSLSSRGPMGICTEPRSLRLKDKNRSEGEAIVKKLFVQTVIQNNELLHVLLEQGSPCVLLPQISSVFSNFGAGSKLNVKSRFSLGLCCRKEEEEASETSTLDDILPDKNARVRWMNGFLSDKTKSDFVQKSSLSPKSDQSRDAEMCASTSGIQRINNEKQSTFQNDGLDHGVFPCVTCGILSSCVAIIQPREAAAQYLASADGSIFSDKIGGVGAPGYRYKAKAFGLDSNRGRLQYGVHFGSGATDYIYKGKAFGLESNTGGMETSGQDELYDVPVQSGSYPPQVLNQRSEVGGNIKTHEGSSSLDLLAAVYGNSDSEEEQVEALVPVSISENKCKDTTLSYGRVMTSFAEGLPSEVKPERVESGSASDSVLSSSSHAMSNCTSFRMMSKCSKGSMLARNTNMSVEQRSDEDACREHIFCLEHAIEVEKQLRSIGGAHMVLLCHPDYARIEAEAKLLAGELGFEYAWKDIALKEATKQDQERIQSALVDEEVTPGNGDWTVNLGINLRYCASLSLSPPYIKQMPYNSVIYKAFGCVYPDSSPPKLKVYKRKKIFVAGRWCGKVWMSDQVHPYLVQRDGLEQKTSVNFATPEQKVEMKPTISLQTNQAPIPEWKPPQAQSVTTTVTRQTGQKRKGTSVAGATQKLNYSLPDSPMKASEDSPGSSSSPQCGRVLRSRQKKHDIPPLRNIIAKNIRKHALNVKQEKELASGPSTRLRKRSVKAPEEVEVKPVSKKQTRKKKKKQRALTSRNYLTIKNEEAEYQCNVDGCTMVFSSKQELALHKRNICPVEDCGKKMFSHRYLVQHQRVHMDARPLRCPWKGCHMTFKWAWSRTEHIRVHTGVRPYVCQEPGCHQTFRFVSDFARHRRKTGHSCKG